MKIPAVTTRRLILPLIALTVLLALAPRSVGNLYGPPLRDVLVKLLSPLSYPLNLLGSRIHGQLHRPVLLEGNAEQLSEQLRIANNLNHQLQRRVEDLEHVIVELEGMRQRLGSGYNFPFTRVIGHSSDIAARTLQIDKGSADGVVAGLPAVAEGNLVGRVTQTGLHSASVLPITAMNTFIEVLVLPPTLPQGRLPGDRKRTIQLKPKNLELLVAEDVDKTVPINVGDYCRLDDRGPEGWPASVQGMIVGQVTKAGPHPDDPLRQRVEVRPLVPLNRLETVTIVVPRTGGSE
jgi:cell shape-determining protein MreC